MAGTYTMEGASGMWNNYYDEVEYRAKNGKDAGGNITYSAPQTLKVRNVSGGKDYVIRKEETSIKYTKEYQIPQMINEGDKIDGRLVLAVEASKDVFGRFHFCIAKVE